MQNEDLEPIFHVALSVEALLLLLPAKYYLSKFIQGSF